VSAADQLVRCAAWSVLLAGADDGDAWPTGSVTVGELDAAASFPSASLPPPPQPLIRAAMDRRTSALNLADI
jgi:hypothetical protein